MNTGGGQLSGARLHGFGLINETCIQLWGDGEVRQIDGAKSAACGTNGGYIAGAMLLTRE